MIKYFDGIVLSHVIEHFKNPFEILESLSPYSKLKKSEFKLKKDNSKLKKENNHFKSTKAYKFWQFYVRLKKSSWESLPITIFFLYFVVDDAKRKHGYEK